MNENYAQPDLPAGAEADVLRGCYRFSCFPTNALTTEVTLMGSGAILTEVIKAARLLETQGIATEVISVTSWSELARDGANCERAELREGIGTIPFIAQQLGHGDGPVIAATDYVRAVPESIRAYLPEGCAYLTLGTDGFGRSDTRAALRRHFGVDAESIAQAANFMLRRSARPD